jgi:hypothetical protein
MTVPAILLRLAILLALLAPPPAVAMAAFVALCSGKVVAAGPDGGPATPGHECLDCHLAAHAPPPPVFAAVAPPTAASAAPAVATPAEGRSASDRPHARAPPLA